MTAYNTSDLEERVTELEDSVANLELGLATVGGEVDDLEIDIANLKESQNIQDERFLLIESEAENTEISLDSLETNAIG